MNISLPGNRMTKALLALCVWLLSIVLAQVSLQNPAEISGDIDDIKSSFEMPKNVQTNLAPAPFGNYSEILERPLLFVERKMPPAAIVSADPAKSRSALQLILEGIAISADSRVALLRNTSDNKLVQLSEGESHGGWMLEELTASRARFRRGDEITEIVLEVNSNPRRRR